LVPDLPLNLKVAPQIEPIDMDQPMMADFPAEEMKNLTPGTDLTKFLQSDFTDELWQ
jgi:hypothetical protein